MHWVKNQKPTGTHKKKPVGFSVKAHGESTKSPRAFSGYPVGFLTNQRMVIF